MAPHEIDPERLPYAPEGLARKPDVGVDAFSAVDMRAGRVVGVEPFPEARKAAWKLTVDFGPVVGALRSSAQTAPVIATLKMNRGHGPKNLQRPAASTRRGGHPLRVMTTSASWLRFDRAPHMLRKLATMSYAYELRILGRLSRTLLREFEELSLAAGVEPVETVLTGPVVDQAALHGLIRRIEALGLELVEVRRLPPSQPDDQRSAPDS